MKTPISELQALRANSFETLEKIQKMSQEEAVHLTREWLKKEYQDGKASEILGMLRADEEPLSIWCAAQELKELERHKEDEGAITEALFLCSLCGIPMPRWLSNAYLSAYREIKQYKAKSWDEVFGRPHPKGTNLDAKRKRLTAKYLVYNEITRIKMEHPETPIDASLFEKVGRNLPGMAISKTLCEEYYYEVKNLTKTK